MSVRWSGPPARLILSLWWHIWVAGQKLVRSDSSLGRGGTARVEFHIWALWPPKLVKDQSLRPFHRLPPIWAHMLLCSAAAWLPPCFGNPTGGVNSWGSSLSPAPLCTPPVTQSSTGLWGWSGGDAAECYCYWPQLPVCTRTCVCVCGRCVVVRHCCIKVAAVCLGHEHTVGSETGVCSHSE